jgi:hypothetical protein
VLGAPTGGRGTPIRCACSRRVAAARLRRKYRTSFHECSFASAIVYRTGASVELDLLLKGKDLLTDLWVRREGWTAAIGNSPRKPTLTATPTILPCSCAWFKTVPSADHDCGEGQ